MVRERHFLQGLGCRQLQQLVVMGWRNASLVKQGLYRQELEHSTELCKALSLPACRVSSSGEPSEPLFRSLGWAQLRAGGHDVRDGQGLPI